MIALLPGGSPVILTRMRIHACMLIVLGLALAGASTWARPLALYNGSPSVGVGWYVREHHEPRPGDYVTVRARDVAPQYSHLRNFDGPDDRFIKRVAAGAGTHVCAAGRYVRVDGVGVVRRMTRDPRGRPLPQWSECRALREGEFFLMGDSADSFDSRYWGPVNAGRITGVWRYQNSAAPAKRLLKRSARA